MKFIFSLIIIILLNSTNTIVADTNTQKIEREQLEQLRENLKNNKSFNNTVKREKEFDISKFRGLIPIILIVLYVIFFKDFKGFDEEEGRIEKKKSKDKNQSRINEFITKSKKKAITIPNVKL